MSARVLRATALGLAVALATVSVRADTPATVWERARDPQVATRDALHAYVEQALTTSALSSVPVLRSSVVSHARDLLLEAHAETSPDARLRFDLGEVYEKLQEHERAVTVLSAAIKDHPDAPGVVDAIESLSFAYARLDRPKEERATYFAYLATVTDEHAKGTAVLNLAEAEMRLGNLPEAIARYRESVALVAGGAGQSSQETTLLATWGLAVALDRAGDPHAAQEEALLGTQLDPGERTLEYGENVFFVPEYERHWYPRAGAGRGGEAGDRAALRRALLGSLREALVRLPEGGGADGALDPAGPPPSRRDARARARRESVARRAGEEAGQAEDPEARAARPAAGSDAGSGQQPLRPLSFTPPAPPASLRGSSAPRAERSRGRRACPCAGCCTSRRAPRRCRRSRTSPSAPA